MKRILTMTLFLLLFALVGTFSQAGVSATQAESNFASIARWTNLYASSDGAPHAGVNLAPNSPVRVIAQEGDWLQVQSGQALGWIPYNSVSFIDVLAMAGEPCPEQGVWPPGCVPGGHAGGGGSSGGGSGSGTACPTSGVWPPGCVPGGSGGGSGSSGGGSGSGNACPTSGVWPPGCVPGGSGGGGPAPQPGPGPGPAPAPAPNPFLNRPAPPAPAGAPATSSTTVQISDSAILSGAKRLGINVGSHNQYGASQLLKNIVPNPGFESAEFAMTLHVRPGATGTRFQSDNWETAWNNENPAKLIGHPQGFWNGAQFEVLSGAQKGRIGTITSFSHAPDAEDPGRIRYTFSTNGGAPLGHEDIVVVRKTVAGYDFDTRATAKAVVGDVRPGSPGSQSIRLTPAGGAFSPAWKADFDSFARDQDNSAGKLYKVEGPYRFEVWVKSVHGGGNFTAQFRRVGETTFMRETVELTGGWQQVVFDFNADANADPLTTGVPSPLSLEFFITSEVLVDDVSLRRSDYNNPTVFSDVYVQRLRELRPGLLRNWGEQRGSTLQNQLVSEFGRKTTGNSPEDRVAPNYHYSLHEFLQLSQTVGANPWYVIPSTFSAQDLQNLMAYLGAPAGSHPYANIRANLGQSAPWTSVFGQIHLEYGNEIWGANFGGDPFIGSSLRGGVSAGQIGNDRIDIMKKSPYYNRGKFDMIIGGQSRFAGRQQEIEDNSDTHDTIGFAPYFAELPDRWRNDAEIYGPAYAHHVDMANGGDMRQSEAILANAGAGTKMAIYEINVHAVQGNSPQDVRNDFMSSQGAGISVPLTMLSYTRDFGITTQAGFTSAQYSSEFVGGKKGRVFGMLRDIEATGVKRPTWLGMELANQAIKNEMLGVTVSGSPTYFQDSYNGIKQGTTVPKIDAFAFRQGNQYALVLFNLDLNSAHSVNLQFPHNPNNERMSYLYSNDIHADNETGWNVDIFDASANFGQNGSITLPPHSMYVIEWNR